MHSVSTQTPWASVTVVNLPALQPSEVRMVLIAGADLPAMQESARQLFEAGHIPVIAEWLAGPIASVPGFDASIDEIFDPLSERLLLRADSVLRLGGASSNADALVGRARAKGLRVFFEADDLIAG